MGFSAMLSTSGMLSPYSSVEKSSPLNAFPSLRQSSKMVTFGHFKKHGLLAHIVTLGVVARRMVLHCGQYSGYYPKPSVMGWCSNSRKANLTALKIHMSSSFPEEALLR